MLYSHLRLRFPSGFFPSWFFFIFTCLVQVSTSSPIWNAGIQHRYDRQKTGLCCKPFLNTRHFGLSYTRTLLIVLLNTDPTREKLQVFLDKSADGSKCQGNRFMNHLQTGQPQSASGLFTLQWVTPFSVFHARDSIRAFSRNTATPKAGFNDRHKFKYSAFCWTWKLNLSSWEIMQVEIAALKTAVWTPYR